MGVVLLRLQQHGIVLQDEIAEPIENRPSLVDLDPAVLMRARAHENVGAGVHHCMEHGDGVFLRLITRNVLVVHRYDDPLRHAPGVMDPLEHAVEIRLVRNDPSLDLVAQGELEIVVRRVAEPREMDLGGRIGR